MPWLDSQHCLSSAGFECTHASVLSPCADTAFTPQVLKTDHATGGFIPHRQLTEELSVFDAEFDACALPPRMMQHFGVLLPKKSAVNRGL